MTYVFRQPFVKFLATPKKNSDILAAPLNPGIVESARLNVDEEPDIMSGFVVTLIFLSWQLDWHKNLFAKAEKRISLNMRLAKFVKIFEERRLWTIN